MDAIDFLPLGAAAALAAGVAAREFNASWQITALIAAFAALLTTLFLRGAGVDASHAAYGASALLLLALIAESDRRNFIVPDLLVLGLFALFSFAPFKPDWQMQAIGALGCGGLLLIVRQSYAALRGADGLGLGDVKLAAAIGFMLGPVNALIAITIGCAAMAVVTLARANGAAGVRMAPLGLGLSAAAACMVIAQILSAA
ncbi:MAG: prepilin peptidase [Hyphomonadaceae bacterium]